MDLIETIVNSLNQISLIMTLTLFYWLANQKPKFTSYQELEHFKERIEKAAQIRFESEFKKQELNLETLVGQDGFNAQAVFDSLPSVLQKCFESCSRERSCSKYTQHDGT